MKITKEDEKDAVIASLVGESVIDGAKILLPPHINIVLVAYPMAEHKTQVPCYITLAGATAEPGNEIKYLEQIKKALKAAIEDADKQILEHKKKQN